MSDIRPAGGYRAGANFSDASRDTSRAFIVEALSAALSYYFEPVKNKRKCQKAVEKIAKSIAEDNIWIRFKKAGGTIFGDSVLESFFNETTAALLLDAVINQRPANQKERREQCFPYWVEACNPVDITGETETALINSFNIIQKKFDDIKNIFNAGEIELIRGNTEKRVHAYRAPQDTGLSAEKPKTVSRISTDIATFADYTGYLSKIRDKLPEDGGINNSAAVFPFVNREDELRELKKFCFSDRQLLWWSLTGKGGAGKSRLGAELCRIVSEERNTWNCVFLPQNFLNRANGFNGNWRLDKNLLAVVDSFNFHIGKIGVWLRQIIESDTVNKKIRLLIIERDGFQNGEPIWIRKLKENVGDSALNALCYKKNLASMEISAPNQSDIDKAIEEFGVSDPYIPGAGRRLRELWEKPVPDFKNPSAASLILQAVGCGVAVEDFTDATHLLDSLYELKIKQIQAAIDAADRNDPVFTATALSLAYSVIISETTPNDKYVSVICRIIKYAEDSPEVIKVKNNFNKINSYMYSGAGGGQPDILCVYSVLKILAEYGRAPAHDRIVINRAWANASHNTANFLYRAIDFIYNEFDLPGMKPELIVLLAPPRRAVQRIQPGLDKTKKLEAALLYSELMVHMSSSGDPEAKNEAVKNLVSLRAKGYSQNKVLAYRLSQAIFNLTAATGQPDDAIIEAAGLAIGQLEFLRSQGFENDRILTLRLIKSQYNLLTHQDREIGKETVKRMDDLRGGGFEQDRDITLILAQSLFILTAKQDEEGVKNTVARLEQLRGQGFEQDREITLELVKALLNLTTKQDEAGRKETVSRIESLRAQGFERDRDFTLELVKALLNLTLKQERRGVEETVLRIQELRGHEFENDKDISLVYAQALLNLTTKQDENEMTVTVATLERLRAQGYEGDRDITFELATALFNLSTRQDEAGVRRTIERLEELRNPGFIRDRDITLRLAQALFSLTTKQGAAGRANAAARIDELRGLGFEQDRDMTLTLVKALYNLTIEQDPEETKDTVARIEDISNRGYAQDKEIKLLFAKALFNLTTKLDESGIAETVARLETLRGV